jgi:hypothetical protein
MKGVSVLLSVIDREDGYFVVNRRLGDLVWKDYCVLILL